MAGQRLFGRAASAALHHGFNLPASAVVAGIDTPTVLAQAVTAAATFRPLSDAEIAAMLAKTEHLATNGATELYKTSHVRQYRRIRSGSTRRGRKGCS